MRATDEMQSRKPHGRARKTELLDHGTSVREITARVTSYRRLNRAWIKRATPGAAGVKSERVVRIIVATDVNRGRPPVGWATRESVVSVLSLAEGRPVKKKKKKKEREKAVFNPDVRPRSCLSFFARFLLLRTLVVLSRAVASLATIKTTHGY